MNVSLKSHVKRCCEKNAAAWPNLRALFSVPDAMEPKSSASARHWQAWSHNFWTPVKAADMTLVKKKKKIYKPPRGTVITP